MINIKIRIDLGNSGTQFMTLNNVKYTINDNFLRVRRRGTNQNILIVPTNKIIYMHDSSLFKKEE